MQKEILILMDPPKSLRPPGALRADVAWKLFFPDEMGHISMASFRTVDKFKRWLWEELSSKGGHLTPNTDEPTIIIAPTMTSEAQDFINRICSYWSDQIFYPEVKDGQIDMNRKGENRWIPPVLSTEGIQQPGSSLSVFHQSFEEGDNTFLSTSFGPSRIFARRYNIKPDQTYSRFHSHSFTDELYLVIKGKGTLRIAGHNVRISKGDLIDKPVGPDISTQFLADLGEELAILDIEVGPVDSRGFKDMVSYPDHRELLFERGGWNFVIPYDNIMPAKDLYENYESGYKRNRDGSWEPKDVPGFKKRNR